jgi:hypothetical protein
LVTLISGVACSTLGEPGSFPSAYPHGGTGVFRALTADEVGIRDGRAVVNQRLAVEGSSIAGGYLFYATAPLLEMPPEVPGEQPANEVYWPAFGPRSVSRAAPRADRGFSAGPPVFTASEPWEEGEVFDPWVVVDGDRVRLYYAAAGGIGLAEATGLEGDFERVGEGPLLDADDAVSGVPRRPSVVFGPDGAWWMYYDAGGAIGVARSDDGRAFTRVDGDLSTPAIDPLRLDFSQDFADVETSEEVSVGSPGAVAVDTPGGRRLIRVYFESRRADGTVRAYVAGTADGVTFERHNVPVLDEEDARFPAPYVLDERVTLLYANVPFDTGGFQTRSIVGSVSPASTTFATEN